MIRFLSVKNLAVVEELQIEFAPGLTVLTGETGAGKSIVLGALGLLVGSRATADLVRTGTNKAVVQATLETADGREVILRREVTAQGRSRAFIDDTLATAGALQELGRQLVDFHGQHEHQALLNPQAHLPLLDAHGRMATSVTAVGESYRTWRHAAARLAQARLSDSDRAGRIELLTFQRDEIDTAAPVLGEDDELAATRTRLANAGRLVELCTEAYGALYERDTAVISTLGQVWRHLEELAAIDPSLADRLDSRAVVQAQLEDLAFSLRSYADTVDRSPEVLAEVEARLETLTHLKKKYGPRLEDVLAFRAEIGEKLEALSGQTAHEQELAHAEAAARQGFGEAAERLSRRRHSVARALRADLAPVLKRLAMPHAHFEVRFDEPLPPDRWNESGIDQIEFHFSANPGETVRPLARIASGGELSRVMLALKTLATTDTPGKTLVFDEVDAGIGGSVADSVGKMLAGLAERFQVLCVTHLPQIAAYATSHHHVSKVVRAGRTVTSVEALAKRGRVAELARLMTGATSPKAVAGAEELLVSKQKTKAKGESERRKEGGV